MGDSGKWAAIVTAGDRAKSHPVFGKNKAFLEIHGVPIVTRVVSALDQSESISEIYAVGPKDRLEHVLGSESHGIKISKPVHCFEQKNTLYENVWSTFLEMLPSHHRGEPEDVIARGPDADIPVLMSAGDMPLLTSTEVDEFVSKCDLESYDYILGATAEKDLEHYYPTDDQPGIHLAYLHFREGNLRQNNLHMVRPFKIINRHYLQIMYDFRYQKEFWNITRLAWEILNKEEGGWGTLGNYLLMQLSLSSDRLGLSFLKDYFRNRTHIDSVINCIAKLIRTRFNIAFTSLGGATLDIDCEHDYNVIQGRFTEWMDYQRKKAGEQLAGASPR
jgi:GTP:adenosylcobinamide-phosphate guanylyltransferase